MCACESIYKHILSLSLVHIYFSVKSLPAMLISWDFIHFHLSLSFTKLIIFLAKMPRCRCFPEPLEFEVNLFEQGFCFGGIHHEKDGVYDILGIILLYFCNDKFVKSTVMTFSAVCLMRHIRMDLLKDSEFFGIFYCFSNFGTILIIIIIILFYRTDAIGIANLQNRITFSHQTQLICGPLSDNVQCAFWC